MFAFEMYPYLQNAKLLKVLLIGKTMNDRFAVKYCWASFQKSFIILHSEIF